MNGTARMNEPDRERKKEGHHADEEKPHSNFWSASVLTPHLRVGIVRGLGVAGSYAERRVMKRRWERGGLGRMVYHL